MTSLQNDWKKEQKAIREALGVAVEFNAKTEILRRVSFLADYLRKTGAKGFVLGISGGQDSTLAGKLAQLAVKTLRKEGTDAQFTAVRLPYGVQADESDAQLALSYIQPDSTLTFNIKATVDNFTEDYQKATGKPLTDFSKGNAKARARMMAQYAIAGENGLLVIGTDHAAEAVTGFFTKYGDGGADILPLSGLTKNQGKEMLHALEAPSVLYTKKPTADLLDNKPQQTDESELGLTYQEIDAFLNGDEVSADIANRLIARYHLTAHKRQLPTSITDEWWKL